MSAPFVRKLRREITANPKKTGILAVMAIVAIWFWVPLVAKWCGATEVAPAASSPNQTAVTSSSGSPASVATPAAVNAATASSSAAVPTTPPHDRWQLVAERLENDSRMKQASEFGKWRDPFGPSLAELAAAEQAAAEKGREKTTKTEQPSPLAAGLVLNSTIIRAGGSVALINGIAYHEGNFVPAGEAGRGFKLVEIRPRQVVLGRDGRRFELHLNTIEIAGPGSKD